jgi:hypothetical protein
MKNELFSKTYITYCLCLLTCVPAMASAYWIDLKGSGKINEAVSIELCYGSMDQYGIRQRDTALELQLTGDFQIRVIDPNGVQQLLNLKMQKDCWLATFIPENEGQYRILGLNDKHPVIDRSATGGKNILPIDYLSATYNVGSLIKPADKPLQLLDFIVTSEGKKVVVKAFFEGTATKSGTKIRVFNPENWEKELLVDQSGEVVFYTTMKGLYIIRQDWIDPDSDTYKGVPFSTKRHRCNFYLWNE